MNEAHRGPPVITGPEHLKAKVEAMLAWLQWGNPVSPHERVISRSIDQQDLLPMQCP